MKHRITSLCSLLLCSLLLIAVLASSSFAATSTNCPTTSIPKPAANSSVLEIGNCASNYTGASYQPYEFTTKLVKCVEGTIRSAVINMMTVVAVEFGWVTSVLATLVIAFYGIRIASGERELRKRTMTLVIKLAFVVGFMNMLPDIVGWVFAILDQVLTLVVGGVSPWQQIDAFLGKLLGFGPSIVLMNGLLGLVGAAIFSSNVGIAAFFFGIIGILNLLTFIISLIYTYLLAFLTIGFLLTIMPIMIPLALFFYTERYFKKWVDLIVAAILTPVLVFAFVWLFLGIFDILIQNIFDVLGGNDFKAYWRMNNSLFSWIMPSDPNVNASLQKLSAPDDVPCTQHIIKPPVQKFIYPLGVSASETGVGRVASLNFGANHVNIMQRLSFAFTTLWIFSSLMKSMVQLLPDVAASMASVNTRIAFGGNSQVLQKLQSGINKMQGKLQSGAAADVSKGVSNFSSQISNMLGNRNK